LHRVDWWWAAVQGGGGGEKGKEGFVPFSWRDLSLSLSISALSSLFWAAVGEEEIFSFLFFVDGAVGGKNGMQIM